MPKSNKSTVFTFRMGRWLLAAALLGLLLACGGGEDQISKDQQQNLENQNFGGCVSVPSELQSGKCPSPQTGTYTFRTETASCKTDNFGKPISTDQSTCVKPNLSVNMEFAQTHVIPAAGLRWYKKASVTDANGRVTANDWIKVSEGVRWAPAANDLTDDWVKTSVPVGAEVPAGYVLDATLRITSSRSAMVLVDTGSNTIRPKNPKLQVWLDGKVQAELPLTAPENLDPTESNGPKYAQNSYSLMLDAKYVKPSLKLKVISDDYVVSNEVAPEIGADGEMAMWVLPFYLFGATEANTFPLTQVGLPDKRFIAELADVWPFAKLDFQSHRLGKIDWPYLVIGPGTNKPAYKMTTLASTSGFDPYSAIYKILQFFRIADGGDYISNQYYAPFFTVDASGRNNTPTGSGLGGGNVGVGDYLYSDTFYHEQGHAFNLGHAGAAFSNSYPYNFGSVKGSAWGYDLGRRKFINRIIPPDAPEFATCKTDQKHLQTVDAKCWKQDPMQSGQGDQAGRSRYTMMSDYYVALIQKWLEGVTTSSNNGSHTYSGGKILLDSNSPTGYSRWDTIDKKRVTYTPSANSNGNSALNQGMPRKTDVPVQTIVFTHSIAGALDITRSYPYPINLDVSQIYPLLPTHTGNLLSYIDPSDRTPAKVAEYHPTQTPYGKYSTFCNSEGCDFTLRVTFSDNTQQHILFQGLVPTRNSSSPSGSFRSFTQYEGAGFGNMVINVSAENGRRATKAELLFTPTPWLTWDPNPQVIFSRVF